jgi:hypothetical protein
MKSTDRLRMKIAMIVSTESTLNRKSLFLRTMLTHLPLNRACHVATHFPFESIPVRCLDDLLDKALSDTSLCSVIVTVHHCSPSTRPLLKSRITLLVNRKMFVRLEIGEEID